MTVLATGAGKDQVAACRRAAVKLHVPARVMRRTNVREVGRAGLARLQEATAEELCDLEPGTRADEFSMESSVVHLSSAVLFENHMTSTRLDRTLRHVARGGLDHYQVRFFFDGGYRSESRGRVATLDPGSIGVCDMGDGERLQIFPSAGRTESHHLAFFFAREALASLIERPDAVGTTTIPGHTPYGRLLAEHLVAFAREAPRLSPAESEVAVRAAATLIAGALNPSLDCLQSLGPTHREAKRAAIKRYIKQHLQSADLNAGFLAARFGVSRATLFRLFEPDGGLSHYVRKCRLECAFAALSSPASRVVHRSILDVALDAHFASESSFIRAFRQMYGLTPGEFRKMVLESHRRAGSDRTGRHASMANTSQWLFILNGPQPARRPTT